MNYNDIKNKDIDAFNKEKYEYTKRTNEKLNAVVNFNDIDKELKRIKGVDNNSLLYGVAVALKDNVNTKGLTTTACSNILKNYVPVYDATIVKKLKDAGCLIMCKASMDELAMGGTNLNANIGKCNNPYDINRITGGSSGGSAALVASGCVAMAIGSDTGDSIRKPAGYCGVVGMKPTYGRISRYGIIPYASSLDTVGFFTSNVEDAALSLEILAGRDNLDLTSSNLEVEKYSQLINGDIKGKKITVIDNIISAIDCKDIVNEFNALIAKLKEKGAIIKHVCFKQELLEALLPTYFIIANAEATANHSNLDGIRFGDGKDGESVEEVMINSRTQGLSGYVRKRFVIGSYSLFEENQEKIFRKAQKVRRVIVNELNSILDDSDVIIAPSAGTIAPKEDEEAGEKLSCTYLVAENHMLLANFSGYPSISVPTAMVDNMPIGINITAKRFEEVNLLNIAKGIEDVCDMKNKTVEVE